MDFLPGIGPPNEIEDMPHLVIGCGGGDNAIDYTIIFIPLASLKTLFDHS